MNTRFIEKIYTKKSIERIKKKTTLLGIYNKINPIDFMNTRLIISLIIFFSTFLFSSYAYIMSPLLTIIFYIGLEYILLDSRIKKRASKLDYEALFFFEVLTLSLETGRNLKGALDLTVRNIDSELSDEFKVTLETIDYGKTLTEALNDMKKRIPSDTINNVILNITHSNVFGNEVVETLYNQVDYLRDKKLFEAKAKIAKMPIKISIVSVIFFIPIILLLILTPVLIGLL
jgi:tight adherence protein C